MASAVEFYNKKKRLRYCNLLDFYEDLDLLFNVVLISENIRRGATHLRLDGTVLYRYRETVDALIEDGRLFTDDLGAEDEIGH